MAVAVVNVGVVWVSVYQPWMFVRVRVRLAERIVRPVLVLVMLVMQVPVAVSHRLVDMVVLVAL